ncbi:DUF4236 domain-containing protein [Azospirillum brasilense]|uniref:DUF4236 domain-containing protein n=1 Tax=Azospirillum argentinense TaxID=2970906 RepID=UPI00190A7014|nr:DUF4236 domain-containing protein [Azospirillum argentinense]
MSVRFRKSIRLFPGVRLNLSGGRVSTTIGIPGASLNLGLDGQAHMTLGIPGTGLSYRARITAPPQAPLTGCPPSGRPSRGRSASRSTACPLTRPHGRSPCRAKSAARRSGA